MKDMSNSSGNYAHLDATICTVQDIMLQLTPQGYVKVLRTGEADAYITSTFNTYLGITTTTAEAQVFNFTVGGA